MISQFEDFSFFQLFVHSSETKYRGKKLFRLTYIDHSFDHSNETSRKSSVFLYSIYIIFLESQMGLFLYIRKYPIFLIDFCYEWLVYTITNFQGLWTLILNIFMFQFNLTVQFRITLDYFISFYSNSDFKYFLTIFHYFSRKQVFD